jgi:hypothetical protein
LEHNHQQNQEKFENIVTVYYLLHISLELIIKVEKKIIAGIEFSASILENKKIDEFARCSVDAAMLKATVD